MKRILFPTDFSPCAENAFEYTCSLALEMNAVVDIVNVYHLPFIDATNVPAEYINQMMDEKRKVIREKLGKFSATAPAEVRSELIPVYGIFVPQELEDLVKEKEYELIAMGTRGENRSSLEKIIGSVTTYTMMQVRNSPVMAIPADAHWEGIKHIAYATNLKYDDHVILNQLLSFGQPLDAEISYIYVDTTSSVETQEGEGQGELLAGMDPNVTVVHSPTVMEGIDKYIRDNKVDVLSLFIPERRLWERLFHSSLTKRMAFHSKTPLLIFHE
ncbi:MAG: universal stress protein [Saprospiraceae bacterium]